MATGWKPSIFSSRPPRRGSSTETPGTAPTPAAPGSPGPVTPPGAPSAASGAKGAGARRGPLPSLAELGAFDGVSPTQAPRRGGRLTPEDLRRLVVPPPERARPSPAGGPEEPLARPKAGRSWHADTPFETVQTAEGVLLKKEAEARAQAQAREQAEAQASASGEPDAPRKTVPAVNVAWSDLNAAVQAGWIRPEAAHALWARWLARKPLTHVEDDGAPLPVLPPLSPPAPSSEPQAAAAPGTSGAPSSEVAQDRVSRVATEEEDTEGHLQGAETSEDSQEAALSAGGSASHADAEADVDAQASAESPDSDAHAPSPAPPRAEPRPEAVEVEILEPLEAANARRKAERAAQPAPIIQVTDVIEALPEKPPQLPKVAPGWVVGQCLIALLAAALTAVSVGLGHVLFGPGGAALAALFWTVMVWRKTSAFHASGQTLRALLGAHLVLPLLALTVWQLQELAGWWPAARPMDLFADAPLDTLARAAPSLQLDWRWLALAGVPLVAAVIWLIRLRRPLMLGAVTALLWVVTFQAVAGVLQALGLAFHGMTVFMILLGGLTLLGGVYIDLKSRAAGVSDFARWPYWCGAALLGAGWLSLSVVPGPLIALRYAGWLLFLALSLSLARPSLVALAVALAGVELTIHLARMLGSDLVGVVVWLAWVGLTAGLLVWMLPRSNAWARHWRFWMPRAWREALARPAAGMAPPVAARKGS